jgi:hypothetical protein
MLLLKKTATHNIPPYMLRPIAPHRTPQAPQSNQLRPIVPLLVTLKPYRRKKSAGVLLCRVLLALFGILLTLGLISFHP